jgi:PHP family Zn ribbon phosphoesterase
MGSTNIELIQKGKLSRNEIYDAFKNQQDQDRLENGHQSGYSGDFQTVSKVDYRLDQVFTSQSEAHDFCLKHASKWDTVVAVYFLDLKVESKRIDKARQAVKALTQDLASLESTPLDKSSGFKTCGACKSRLSMSHVKRSCCPVCQSDLRPKALVKRIESLKAKIKAAQDRLESLVKSERQKALTKAKPSQFSTMLAGWGAC